MALPSVEIKLEDVLAKMDSRLERIENDLTDIKVNQARMEEKLSGQISVVDEKVTGLSKRLDFQEFVNRGILTALIVALIAGAAKFFGFMPNP
ncbi:MAG: DUF4164 domain-containing protein [Microcystaceae cyanobacterium]